MQETDIPIPTSLRPRLYSSLLRCLASGPVWTTKVSHNSRRKKHSSRTAGGRSQNPRPISCLAPSGPPAKRMNRGYKHGNSFSSRRPLLIILPSPRARAEQYKTYISVYICASGRKYIPTHARRILFPSDADGFGRRVSSDRR